LIVRIPVKFRKEKWTPFNRRKNAKTRIRTVNLHSDEGYGGDAERREYCKPDGSWAFDRRKPKK
jgi:hypothetical protein